jgi:GT2 family glycosyltransferase
MERPLSSRGTTLPWDPLVAPGRTASPITYRTAPPDLPSVRRLFYGLYAAILAGLVGGLGFFVIRWDHPSSVALFAVLSALFVGSAYGATRQVVALVGRKAELPALGEFATRPKVAILYTTMNDVVGECLLAIRQDYPVDVFVLDDSTDPSVRSEVDRIATERGYRVLRRPQRRGFKAGAVNEWYAQWGARYDYFVLLDADSYLPRDWVSEALKYAEHPANQQVGIFQGLINIWNFDTRFVQTLAPLARVGQFVWEAQLANALDAVFCYGHNVLIRRRAIDSIGGIVEGYVSEDFATAIALADRGWHSRFVPLHTYEAMPENVRGFMKRQKKWTRGAMEFIGLSHRSRLSLGRKFHLWQTPWSHFTNLLLPVGMLLTVYGFASTPATALAFVRAFAAQPVATFWSIPLLRYLLAVGILTTTLTTIVYRRCGIGWGTYWRHRWLSSAVSAVTLPYEAICMASYLRGRFRPIPVTPKNEAGLRLGEVLWLARYSLLLEGLLLVGLFLWNPLGSVFNATWLIPTMFAPGVIVRFSGPPVIGEGPRSVPVRAEEVPSREARAHDVHASLSRIRESGRLPWAGHSSVG